MISDPLYRYRLTPKEVEDICREYNLGSLIDINGDLGGLFNVNLKVTTVRGSYVIRILSGLATEEHLKFQQVITTILRYNGIPVLIPLKNGKGRFYSIYRDRFLQVTPYIDGCEFTNSIGQISSNGKMLRNIHDVLSSIEINVIPKWSNYPSDALLQEGFEKLRDHFREEEIAPIYDLYDKVTRKWKKNIVEVLPATIIHGDWHSWNQLYTAEGEVKCVMDFDFIQKAERIHDVAYSLWAMLSNKYMNENIRMLGSRFLSSYGKLTEAEINILPAAVARISLFFLCTASFTADPVDELNKQLKNQKPFIEWVLSEQGEKYLKNSAKSIRSVI